jgi:hypothetical protein
MEDLIKALQILLKYGNPKYPTVCSHDELNIVGINPELISDSDKNELRNLGFLICIEGVYDEENDYMPEESKIFSFRYGSA